MDIMATGLLGDVGVARWQSGDREGFVGAFDEGMTELSQIEVDESLNARHCHAIFRHSLLWAQDQLTDNVIIGNGENPSLPVRLQSRVQRAVLSSVRQILASASLCDVQWSDEKIRRAARSPSLKSPRTATE